MEIAGSSPELTRSEISVVPVRPPQYVTAIVEEAASFDRCKLLEPAYVSDSSFGKNAEFTAVSGKGLFWPTWSSPKYRILPQHISMKHRVSTE